MIKREVETLNNFSSLSETGPSLGLSASLTELEERCDARLPNDYISMFSESSQASNELRNLRVIEWNVAQANVFFYRSETWLKQDPFFWSHIYDPEQALKETIGMQKSEWGHAFEFWPSNALVIGTYDGDHPLVLLAGEESARTPVINLENDPGGAFYFSNSVVNMLRKLQEIAGAEFYQNFIRQPRKSQHEVCDSLISELSSEVSSAGELAELFAAHAGTFVPDKEEELSNLLFAMVKNLNKEK